MAASSPWPLIHGERQALAADLATLTDEEWATASLCPGWSVRDVLGHLIGSGPEVTGPALSLLMAMTGRAAALDDLSGEGVPTLRSRM